MLAQPTDFVDSLGYLGVFLLIFLFPVPQEIVLPLAGFIAAQGKLSLIWIVVSSVTGSTLGALPWYWAGRYFGEERLIAWAGHRQRWIKLSPRNVQTAKQWFEQSGSKAILLSQFVPILRTLIAVPAGMSRMNLGLFLLCLVCSAIAWQGLLACAGYLLGSRYGLIHQYTALFRSGIIALMVIGIVWLFSRKQ